MKYNSRKLLLLIFLLISLSIQSFAQNNEKKEQTPKEKQKETEAREFVKNFIAEIDNKKDFDLLSPSYFIKDFKENFETFKFITDELPKELGKEEIIESKVEMFNLMYLFLLNLIGNDTLFNSETDDDMNFDKIVSQLFNNQISEKMKQNHLVRILIDDKSDDLEEHYLKNTNQLKNDISELKEINKLIKIETNTKSSKLQETYLKNISKLRENIDFINSYSCEESNCDGLPPKTIIYHHDYFPFCITLIEENRLYKIKSISFYSN